MLQLNAHTACEKAERRDSAHSDHLAACCDHHALIFSVIFRKQYARCIPTCYTRLDSLERLSRCTAACPVFFIAVDYVTTHNLHCVSPECCVTSIVCAPECCVTSIVCAPECCVTSIVCPPGCCVNCWPHPGKYRYLLNLLNRASSKISVLLYYEYHGGGALEVGHS